MGGQTAIAASSSMISTGFDQGVEAVVRDVVGATLNKAGMVMDDVDTVVTVASDTLDGVMIPIRAEIAGSFGKSYINVPSSAGHALAASVALIESGQAEKLLLVGWGAASRLAQADSRVIQADPFYDRPAGASPAALTALQARELAARQDAAGGDPAGQHAAMLRRAWDETELNGAATAADAWLGPTFCDGAVALLLCRAADGDGRVTIADFGSAARPYCPQDETLDPAAWLAEAIGNCIDPAHVQAADLAIAEAAGPSVIGEAQVLGSLARAKGEIEHWNQSGGGAAAWFGPATGLRQLASAAEALVLEAGRAGAMIDCAGPLGQHVTFVLLQGSQGR